MPDCVLGEFNRLIAFLWRGKNDLVARAVVIQPLEYGGFSMVSLPLKVWACMFKGSVALLDAFQAGGNSSFTVLSAVCLVYWQDRLAPTSY